MYKRRKIVNFLDTFLEIGDIDDIWYDNGLVIEGKDVVSSIAMAVDPTKDVVKKAIEREYDMLITHHGMFYKQAPIRIRGNVKRKINAIIESNLNHYVAHLPLDVHEEIGNAPTILKRINAKYVSGFIKDGIEVGAIGEMNTRITFNDLLNVFTDNITSNVLGMNFGSKHISVVCAFSTNVEDIIYESVEFDAIILPTMDHLTYQDAKEYGINIIYANQYDLDKLAFSMLAEKLKQEFPKLYIDFIEDSTLISIRNDVKES